MSYLFVFQLFSSILGISPKLFLPYFLKNVDDVQSTTSNSAQNGGAYCGSAFGGKCMVSKAKLVVYAFAV